MEAKASVPKEGFVDLARLAKQTVDRVDPVVELSLAAAAALREVLVPDLEAATQVGSVLLGVHTVAGVGAQTSASCALIAATTAMCTGKALQHCGQDAADREALLATPEETTTKQKKRYKRRKTAGSNRGEATVLPRHIPTSVCTVDGVTCTWALCPDLKQ